MDFGNTERSKSMSEEQLWFYLNQEVIEGRMSDADATQIWLEEQEDESGME